MKELQRTFSDILLVSHGKTPSAIYQTFMKDLVESQFSAVHIKMFSRGQIFSHGPTSVQTRNFLIPN
jgi:hypothetical protein